MVVHTTTDAALNARSVFVCLIKDCLALQFAEKMPTLYRKNPKCCPMKRGPVLL